MSILALLYYFDKKCTFSQHLPSQSLNSNNRVRCERCSRLIKKALARRKSIFVVHLLGLNKLYTLSDYMTVFEKQVNFQCDIGSIPMLISSYIHNAVNLAIAKSIWQSHFKKLKFSFLENNRMQ